MAPGRLALARGQGRLCRAPQAGWPSLHSVTSRPVPLAQADAFNRLLRAAMHMPAVEALFPAPWTAAARRMLPSPSPQLTATEMWGPVLAWCVLQWLAESIDTAATRGAHLALDLFDRLRLREPFGHAFTALGFKGKRRGASPRASRFCC